MANSEQSDHGQVGAEGKLGGFLEALSLWWLVVLAVGMGLAPWPAGPMPHLLEKTWMLIRGTLHRPIDIFDLVVHALPLVLLIAKLFWKWKGASSRGDSAISGG